MARIVFQDQECVVPDREVSGEELMETLKVPPGHSLVAIGRDGNRVVHRDERVRPQDGSYFLDAPTFQYGVVVA